MVAAPRVAFFPDSFHEVNGVAHTARNFVAYAERQGLPMLCVRAALPLHLQGRKPLHEPQPQPKGHTAGSVASLELPRSWAAVGMEKDLSFDPLFARHAGAIERALRAFKPDVIHIYGAERAWDVWCVLCVEAGCAAGRELAHECA